MAVDNSIKSKQAGSKVRELYSADEIARRIDEMGAQISADLASDNVEHPVIIGVMKGAIIFLADLVRHIECREAVQIEFVRLASYGGATESTGVVQTPYLDLPNIFNRHIIVVEDIVDSGRTARFFLDYLRDQYKPASLRIAAFLDKPSRRMVPVNVDYVGFTIDDLFVVGYGLDYAEKYRELPFLGELTEPEAK